MDESVVRVGVIGCGRWGPNHIRVFSEISGAASVMCADPDGQRLEAMAARFRDIRTSREARALVEADDIDAVVIATPVETHDALVRDALAAGKDVLCEKPLVTNAAGCRELADAAAQAGRILMVGHVFLHNAGILELKRRLEAREVGALRYLHTTRTNLGPVRRDVGATADLATHDISILNFLLEETPTVVSAAGGSFLQDGLEDVAFITLKYPSGVVANMHVSWLDPVKVRRIAAVGSEKMIVWDDLGKRGPIEIYDHRVVREDYATFGEFQLLARDGDVVIPHVRSAEPLRSQAEAFIDAVRTRTPPVSDARFAATVAQTLESVRAMVRNA